MSNPRHPKHAPTAPTAVRAAAGGSSWAPGLLSSGVALVTVAGGPAAPRLDVRDTEMTAEGMSAGRRA